MKIYDIVKSKTYTNKNGEEKKIWQNVGTLKEFTKDDGTISRFIEIPAIGLEANVFEQKPRYEDKKEQDESMSDDINIDDIPF